MTVRCETRKCCGPQFSFCGWWEALDLNLLVALESLLQEVSVGRAADRVALSQPAMSYALKRLRSLLNDPLLVRVGARMQLTSRAEALLYPVQDALARVRDLLVGEGFEPSRSSRTFRLYVADNAGDLLLPPLLKRLGDEAPNVGIRFQPWLGNGMDQFELARAVDVAIACVPEKFKGFYQQRLFTDRDACAVRRGHPIAGRFFDAEKFLKAKHVAVVGREFAEDPVDTWLREEGRERNVALTVPHYLQALHVVAQSDLIAVIPERLKLGYVVSLGGEFGCFGTCRFHRPWNLSRLRYHAVVRQHAIRMSTPVADCGEG